MINLNIHLFHTYLFLSSLIVFSWENINKETVALIDGCSKEPLWRASIPGIYRIIIRPTFKICEEPTDNTFI